MIRQDWTRWGNDIKNLVQDAIETQDFHKLSQDIRATLQDAANVWYQNRKEFSSYQTSHTTTGYHYEKATYQTNLRTPSLYRQTFGLKTRAMLETALGGFLGCGVGIALIVITAVGPFAGFLPGLRIAAGILIPIFILLLCVTFHGKKLLDQVKRFLRYQEILGSRTYCDIKDLADSLGRSTKDTLKDIKKMLSDGWFLQGHLDQAERCLITSHDTYEHYRNLEAQRQAIQAEEKKKTEADMHLDRLPAAAREAIETGRNYVRLIRESNDRIPGEDISNKISRLELIVARIFERIEQYPEMVSDIHKMMEYYLPTTMKLLHAYEELDRQPVQGENILSSKKEIEATIDTLNEAFERLLDNLFKEVAWDVSTDISVLQTMLAQEGLTGKDFDV